jgi:hypothetical protein
MPVAELVVDTTDQGPVETARQIALHLRG